MVYLSIESFLELGIIFRFLDIGKRNRSKATQRHYQGATHLSHRTNFLRFATKEDRLLLTLYIRQKIRDYYFCFRAGKSTAGQIF